jgi:prepilin-type N-terminal cleavage/methylation domain-containing protein
MLKQSRRGFTLVEVLIVVVILGILAATVLPQFTSANNDAKESALVQDLQTLRSQIELFQFQHEGKSPSLVPASTKFSDHMLLSSDVKGVTGVPGSKPFGPYFVGGLPPNPFTGARDVVVIATAIDAHVPDQAAVGEGGKQAGWVYSTFDGRVKANITATEKAADGTPLHQL